MEKRRQLAGDADPSKTTTLLDLLEIKCLISRSQSDAGRYFGWLRRRIYGRTQAPALDPNLVRGRAVRDDCGDWERLETQYRLICRALNAEGPQVRTVTEDLCVYDRCGRLARKSPSDVHAALALLKLGLDTIERVRSTHRPTLHQTPGRGEAT